MRMLPRFFFRRRRYDDISVSIREHIAERIDELTEEGMTFREAEQQTRREFGNVTLMEQRSREAWQWAALESILTDLRFALRRLGNSPGFTATVLLTLAIGIGANTSVFSVINSVLLKPLPYPDSGRIAALWLDAPGASGLANFSSGLQISPSMYLTFAEHNHTFQSMGIWVPSTANVTGVGQPEWVQSDVISDGVLQTLDVPPFLGRWLSGTDQDPHGAKTAMLSYGYWQRRFGGDRSVIGRAIQVDAETRTVVGVMPRGFRIGDQDFDLLLPYALDRAHLKLAPFCCNGIGRLKPGVPLAQANADLARLLPVWMDSWSNGPGTNPHYYEQWRITPNLRPLKQQVIGNIGNVLWVVMATVGLVMLIACANIANLMLVRAEARHQELTIRAALGAGRARIARELLIESLTLGLVGGILAVGVAYGGLRLLTAIGPADLPRLSEVSLDARSLGLAFMLSVLSGLFFGSIPVLRFVRARPGITMSQTNRTASAGRTRQRSRSVLVITQVALALVLLVSALLMIRTFAALRGVRPGFTDAADLQTFSTWIPDQLIGDSRMVMRTENDIVDQLSAIPGVSAVGFAGAVPMDGNDPNWDQILVEGKWYEGTEPPMRLFNYVSPGYFHVMGTHLVAGRDFTWADVYNLRPEVIVSENFARESWGSAAAAVGKRVHQFTKTPWQEVIGVAEDVHVHGVDEKAPAMIYWPAMLYSPYTPTPTVSTSRYVTFVLRSNQAGTSGLLNRAQQAVWAVNPNLPMASIRTMQELYNKSMARTSFTLVMLAIAGGMALALSLIGIYGVISFAVTQRTREIGIRLALGAQKNRLHWMFVRSALRLTGLGIAFGLAAAGFLVQLMKSLVFGIHPLDPVTFIAVPLILTTAAALASYLPARRAVSVDPVQTLRAE